MKFFNAAKGSISVFLILVLLPIYTCIYLAIDSVRYESAKTKLEGALNLAGVSALDEYDITLKELYGLFAMSDSQEKMESLLSGLFSTMVDTAELAAENMISTTTQRFHSTYEESSALVYPPVMEQYMTDYMKYRGPYYFSRGLASKLQLFGQASSAASVLETETEYFESLKGLDKTIEEIGLKTKPITEGKKAKEQAKKNITVLLEELNHLRKESAASEKEADAWNAAIGKMDAGELKTLLSGEYKNIADPLSKEHITALEKTLKEDLEILGTWKEEEPFPSLNYEKDPLYLYIQSSIPKEASSEEKESAKEKKKDLQALASTTNTSLFNRLPSGSVSSVLGVEEAQQFAEIGSNQTPLTDRNTKKELKQVKTVFSALSQMGKNTMENCYIEEYITDMFSCYVTPEDAVSCSNYELNQSPIFRSETEYILFGADALKANLLAVADLLFAVRMVFNTLYAFGNAKMRKEALAVAGALAGWTGIGITAAQNGILLLWAAAESTLDVSTLCKGGTIPIFKSANTWTLSLNGVTGTLAGGAEELACREIEDIFEKIESLADEKVEEIADATSNYFRQTTEGAAESVVNAIVTPIEMQLTALIGNKTIFLAGWTESQIRDTISNAVNTVENQSPAFRQAKQVFLSRYLDDLSREVYQKLGDLTSEDASISSVAASALERKLMGIYESLFSAIKTELTAQADAVEGQIESILSSTKGNVKNQVVGKMNEYAEQMASYLGSSATAPQGAISASSGLSMSYQDFLKMMVFVGLQNAKWKQNMLLRSAQVMQINGAKKTSGFRITACYTSITLEADVAIAAHKVKGKETYVY